MTRVLPDWSCHWRYLKFKVRIGIPRAEFILVVRLIELPKSVGVYKKNPLMAVVVLSSHQSQSPHRSSKAQMVLGPAHWAPSALCCHRASSTLRSFHPFLHTLLPVPKMLVSPFSLALPLQVLNVYLWRDTCIDFSVKISSSFPSHLMDVLKHVLQCAII